MRHVIADSPYIDVLRERTMRQFACMTCVDALIGNFDRSSDNWGFITDARSNIIDLAPVYDCGSSLAPHLSAEEMRARLDDPSLMREVNLASPVLSMTVNGKHREYAHFMVSAQAREFRHELIDLWPRIGKDVTDRVIDNVPGIDDLHRDFYRATIDTRREYVLKPALDLALEETRSEPDIRPHSTGDGRRSPRLSAAPPACRWPRWLP